MGDTYISRIQLCTFCSDLSMEYTKKALSVREEEPRKYELELEYLNEANAICKIPKILEDIPPADVEPRKRGEWVCEAYSDSPEDKFIICPYCGRSYNIQRMFELLGNNEVFNRCPECGLLADNEVFEIQRFYFGETDNEEDSE